MDERSIQTGGSEHLPPPAGVPRHGESGSQLDDPAARRHLNSRRMRMRGLRSLRAAVSTIRRKPAFSNIGVKPT